jgi:hypothetical protein
MMCGYWKEKADLTRAMQNFQKMFSKFIQEKDIHIQ